MIINLNQFGNGGGGGGYVLPIASQSTLGGVKIGSGVNIDSAGTISVNSSDPSTLKSVSALPLTAASGDVVVYDNMEWYYSPTTGSSVNITKSGKIIRVKYYNLPNGAKFPFPNEDVGQTPQTGPWITYDNGYFYFCWEEDGQTITGETYSMNSHWVIFENLLEGVHSGSQTYGEMVFNFNGYDFSLYTEGNWPNQSVGHWEPLDWSSGFKPSLPIATNVDCGLVRIGNGINVDSAGTISAGNAYGLNEKSAYDVDDRNFAFANSVADLGGIVNDETNGFSIDMTYIPKEYQGHLFTSYVPNGLGGQIEMILNSDGFYIKLVNSDADYQLIWEGTGSTYGEYTYGSGTTDECVLTYNRTKIAVNSPNYSSFTGTCNLDSIPVPFFKVNNVSCKIPLINASELTNGVSFWKGTQAEYDAMSGTGYDSSTLYIITPSNN